VAAKIKAMQESQHHTTVSTEVLLTDFNKVVVRNCQQNIALNGLEGIATADELDFYKQDTSVEGWLDSSGSARDQVDLILAADVICQAEDAFAAARTIFSALKPGGKALVVSADSRHRFGVDKFEEACRSVDLHVTSDEVRNLYDGKLLSANMEKTTGYVDNMTLTMFTIFKPSRL
jgi:predicted nicotinamide N-methyase